MWPRTVRVCSVWHLILYRSLFSTRIKETAVAWVMWPRTLRVCSVRHLILYRSLFSTRIGGTALVLWWVVRRHQLGSDLAGAASASTAALPRPPSRHPLRRGRPLHTYQLQTSRWDVQLWTGPSFLQILLRLWKCLTTNVCIYGIKLKKNARVNVLKCIFSNNCSTMIENWFASL